MDAQQALSRITVASPCHERWDEMSGDERQRFCQLCQKNVYDLSTMTSTEALDLIRETEGTVCGRLYRRADGTVITADCPVGIARGRSKKRRLIASSVAAFLGVAASIVGFAAVTCPPPTQASVTSNPVKRWITDLKIRLGLTPPPPQILMGEICVPEEPPSRSG